MSNSPVLGTSFNPISWSGDACEQLAEMFRTNEKLALLFGWMLDNAGAISDGALDSFNDRAGIIGEVRLYAGSVLPSDKWMFARGQAVLRADYPILFGRIGTTYGSGDGVNTFNLPNSQNRAVVGAGDQYVLGDLFGLDSVVLTFPQIPIHYHGIGSSLPSTNDAFFTGRNWSLGDHGTTSSFKILGDGVGAEGNPNPPITGGDLSTSNGIINGETPALNTGHENRPPSIAMNHIIKVK